MSCSRAIRAISRPAISARLFAPAVSRAVAQPLAAWGMRSASRALSTATDAKLKSVLDVELSYEEKENVVELEEESKAFLAKTKFELVDKPGSNWVELRGKFKGDTVVVSFNGQANYSENVENEEGEEEEFSNEESVETTIRIARENQPGLLLVRGYSSSDAFDVQFIEFVKDGSLINKSAAEFDKVYESDYQGPDFNDLADELQESFAAYLKDRHVDGDLGAFIREYAVFKEQNEYVHWLKSLSQFFKK